MAAENLMQDTSFWLNRAQVEEAEYKYQVALSVQQFGDVACPQGSLASEIAKARNQIKQSLNLDKKKTDETGVQLDGNVINRIVELERENKELRQVTSDLQAAVKKLEAKVNALEGGKPAKGKKESKKSSSSSSSEDSDFSLFGSDDEEEKEEANRVKEERLAQYAAKKQKKPALIAKSNLILDVKPWDDETDMKKLEECVRTIAMDGLLWGTSKFVAVGYGIKKLQISCVVEDDKVSTDDLEDQITGFEDYVQSMDIAAFNKV